MKIKTSSYFGRNILTTAIMNAIIVAFVFNFHGLGYIPIITEGPLQIFCLVTIIRDSPLASFTVRNPLHTDRKSEPSDWHHCIMFGKPRVWCSTATSD